METTKTIYYPLHAKPNEELTAQAVYNETIAHTLEVYMDGIRKLQATTQRKISALFNAGYTLKDACTIEFSGVVWRHLMFVRVRVGDLEAYKEAVKSVETEELMEQLAEV